MRRIVKKGVTIIIAAMMCMSLLSITTIAAGAPVHDISFPARVGSSLSFMSIDNFIKEDVIVYQEEDQYIEPPPEAPDYVQGYSQLGLITETHVIYAFSPATVTVLRDIIYYDGTVGRLGFVGNRINRAKLIDENTFETLSDEVPFATGERKSVMNPAPVFGEGVEIEQLFTPAGATYVLDEGVYSIPGYGTPGYDGATDENGRETLFVFWIVVLSESGELPAATPDNPNIFDGADEWVINELGQSYNINLIPDSMVGNWKQPTNRLLAAEAIVALIEANYGDIEELANWYGFDMSNGFSDTDSKAATFLKASGISVGVGNNKYNPDGIYTRAEMVTMLGRMAEKIYIMDLSSFPLGSSLFTDVPDWADKYVGWAGSVGVTNGVGGGLFGSYGTLDNQQTVVFMHRALDFSNANRP